MEYLFLSGPLIFIVITTILGLITPEYSNRRNYISELSNRKYGMIQKINFIVSGILIFSLCILLFSKSTDIFGKTGWSLGIIFGIGLTIMGFFNTSYGLSKKTVAGVIHEFVYMNILIPCLGMAYIVLGWNVHKNILLTILSWAMGIFSFLIFKYSQKLKMFEGTSQRILVFLAVTWLEVIAIYSLF